MENQTRMRLRFLALSSAIPALLFLSLSCDTPGKRMPITTDSELALELYETGMLAFDQVKIDYAFTNLEMAVEEDPNFFMAYFWMYFLSGKSYKKVAERALHADAPLNDAEREIRTAFKYLLDGEDMKVVDHLEKAIEMYPSDPHVYKILYIIQFQFLKDLEGALKTMYRAIEAAPGYPMVYNQLGYALMEKGDFKKAEEAFNTYLELAPGIANPYDSKGDYFMATEQYERAYESYMRAFEIDSGFAISEKKAMKARHIMEESISD